MMRIRFVAVLLSLVSLAGCGYHFSGENDSLPGNVQALYIAMFDNRTKEPFLENLVTNSVVEKFSRTGKFSVVEAPALADAVLSCTVTYYKRSASAYDVDDTIVEYRSQIKTSCKLRHQGDNSILWKGSVSWDQEYLMDSDRTMEEDFESLAQKEVSQKIADEIYSRITDNF